MFLGEIINSRVLNFEIQPSWPKSFLNFSSFARSSSFTERSNDHEGGQNHNHNHNMNLLAFGLPRISTCQPYPPENGQATMRNDAFNTTLLKEQLKQFVTKMLWSYDELPLVREASPLERPSMSSPWHLLCQGCKKIIIYWGSAFYRQRYTNGT